MWTTPERCGARMRFSRAVPGRKFGAAHLAHAGPHDLSQQPVGDFSLQLPLKPGIYELRLHFAETFYGPENSGGGGEGSRTMSVSANGQELPHDFDVLADAAGDRTADVKVFPSISPSSDGQSRLAFSSGHSGSAIVSGIEILPGVRGQIRPVRIVARDAPYYSDDSRWWSPDMYFKGGQLRASQEPAEGTDDPEFYETERWGHF